MLQSLPEGLSISQNISENLLQNLEENFIMFQNFPKCYRIFQMLRECSIEGSRTLQNLSQSSKMLQNLPNCIRISRLFQNITECYKMFHNVKRFENIEECSQVFPSIPEYSRVYVNVLECLRTLTFKQCERLLRLHICRVISL